MPRAQTSELVRLANREGDPLAAVTLLDQSMALGHRKIALIRYFQARCLRAPLAARHHAYAEQVAARMSTATLTRVMNEAQARAARCGETDRPSASGMSGVRDGRA